MLDFGQCLIEAGLTDHPYQGPLFTWTNKQTVYPVVKKLDRMLVNGSWFTSFPNSIATFLPPTVSNHCAMLLQSSFVPASYPKPFKFFSNWLPNRSFLPIVDKVWNQNVHGAEMFQVVKKLKLLKSELKSVLHIPPYSLLANILSTKNELELVQVAVLNDPSNADMIQIEHDLLLKHQGLKTIEEATFRHKSRVNWISLGDQNTSFFYKTVAARKSFNAISDV